MNTTIISDIIINVFNEHGVYLPDENFQDEILSLDSIQFISIICSLEENFEIEISNLDFIDPTNCTVKQFIALMEENSKKVTY